MIKDEIFVGASVQILVYAQAPGQQPVVADDPLTLAERIKAMVPGLVTQTEHEALCPKAKASGIQTSDMHRLRYANRFRDFNIQLSFHNLRADRQEPTFLFNYDLQHSFDPGFELIQALMDVDRGLLPASTSAKSLSLAINSRLAASRHDTPCSDAEFVTRLRIQEMFFSEPYTMPPVACFSDVIASIPMTIARNFHDKVSTAFPNAMSLSRLKAPSP